MVEWLETLKWPSWVVYIAPEGAMYSPETRRAYGSYVSSYRAPASQVWWTSYPTWTACIMGLGGLFHPSGVIGCQALFASMGVAFFIMAGILAWRRPLRSVVGNHLGVAAKIILGLVLFCLTASLTDPSGGSAAVIVLGFIMTAVTIIRVVHAIVCMYFDHRMAKDEVALTTVWSHVPGESKKTTHAFSIDGADLGDEASRRDVNEEPLLEMEGVSPSKHADPTSTSHTKRKQPKVDALLVDDDADSDPLQLKSNSNDTATVSSDQDDDANEAPQNTIQNDESIGSSSLHESSSPSSSSTISLGSTDDDML